MVMGVAMACVVISGVVMAMVTVEGITAAVVIVEAPGRRRWKGERQALTGALTS